MRQAGNLRIFRASKDGYIGFGFIFGSMLVFVLLAYRNSPSPEALKLILLLIAVISFIFYWLSAFYIIITPEELEFRSLFGARRSIPLNEIKSVTTMSFPHYRGRMNPEQIKARKKFGHPLWFLNPPPNQLLVYSLDDTKNIDINAKVFSREAIRAVLDLDLSRKING